MIKSINKILFLLLLTGCYPTSQDFKELTQCKARVLCESAGGFLFIKYSTLYNLDGIVIACKGRLSYTNIQRMEVNGCLDLDWANEY